MGEGHVGVPHPHVRGVLLADVGILGRVFGEGDRQGYGADDEAQHEATYQRPISVDSGVASCRTRVTQSALGASDQPIGAGRRPYLFGPGAGDS